MTLAFLHRQFNVTCAKQAGNMPTYWFATSISLSNDREQSWGPMEDSVA